MLIAPEKLARILYLDRIQAITTTVFNPIHSLLFETKEDSGSQHGPFWEAKVA